jgi:hypothetical protein
MIPDFLTRVTMTREICQNITTTVTKYLKTDTIQNIDTTNGFLTASENVYVIPTTIHDGIHWIHLLQVS